MLSAADVRELHKTLLCKLANVKRNRWPDMLWKVQIRGEGRSAMYNVSDQRDGDDNAVPGSGERALQSGFIEEDGDQRGKEKIKVILLQTM